VWGGYIREGASSGGETMGKMFTASRDTGSTPEMPMERVPAARAERPGNGKVAGGGGAKRENGKGQEGRAQTTVRGGW